MINRTNITREALSELEMRRDENRRIEKERRKEAERKSPLVAVLLKERENLFFTGVKTAFANPKEARDISSTMGQKVDCLNKKIRKALLACDLPEDYLQPIYGCPECQDTGYVGELIRTPCSCLKRAVMKKLYEDDEYRILEAENFDTFDERIFPDQPIDGFKATQREYIRKIRKLCEHYADGFEPKAGKGLVLSGKTGLGKSFLLHCIAQRVLEHGYSVMMLSAERLLDIMRQSLFEERDDGRLVDLLCCDLLCVDDLGAEPMLRGITVGALYQIVNERRNKGGAIVLTTNLDADGIYQRYDDRVGSRLTDPSRMRIVPFVGIDVRRFISKHD